MRSALSASRLVVPVVLLVLLLGAGVARARVIGGDSATGKFAVTAPSGSVSRPHRLTLQVRASPRQRIDGNYSVICIRGLGVEARTGAFSGRTTLNRTLRMPFRNPDNCAVTASVQLAGSGRLTLRLFAS